MKNLEGPPHSPGLVVLEERGRYAGMLSMDDLAKELSRLYNEACDKPGQRDWADRFFNQCEIARVRKVSEIMGGKEVSVEAGDGFESACELILGKNLKMVPVVGLGLKVVGIITRRMVLQELGPKMFR